MRHLSKLITAPLLAVILLVTASLACSAPAIIAPTPTPTATSTATPTATPPPTYTPYPTYTPFPTDTPLPTATPTATLTPTPLPPSAWRTVISDTFDENFHDWRTGSYDDELAATRRDLTNGKYHWDVKAHKGVISWVYPDIRTVSDFSVSVDAQQIRGPDNATYGVVFRVDTDKRDYYYFAITNSQYFAFFLLYEGEWTNLIDWTKSSAIRPGEVNRIAVLAQGPSFSFYINDQLVDTAEDDHLERGKVGLAIDLREAGDRGVFEFDNFEVRAP